MNVLCRSCGGSYHETTDNYDPAIMARGDMFKLKEPFAEWGWTSFPENDATIDGSLECPDCGAPYAEHGRVRVEEEWPDDKIIEHPNEAQVEAATQNEQESLDPHIKEMHEGGATPTEIAKALNLGHYMTVVHRLKEMGLK